MKDCNNESKCLASLAVFRGLYNSKNDVYCVISEFLKEIIIVQSKYQFSLSEITLLLNSTYDFHLPEAIVQTALKRIDFVSKGQGLYVASSLASQIRPEIYKTQEEQQIKNNIILEELFKYIQEIQKIKLTQEQKAIVTNSFCSFLLDDSNGHEYSEYISAFIISRSKELEFTKQLNFIKEGVVLYSGIRYNSNINNLGSWNTPLTIYIETEVLFHFAGYNGEVYESLFSDFFSFVTEINTKAGKRLIELKYFNEVKDEIERFFKKAEFIVDGHDMINPSMTAMRCIVNGCDSPADVVLKKIKFFELLADNEIREDDYKRYFDEENHKFNILDQKTLDNVAKDLKIEDINDALQFLNYINIHRKEKTHQNFENIKVILLSGNSTTLRVAWHNDIKEQGNVPLATNLSFITNKFWFKLNKGFGKDNYPKTFDIITKAQIILSTQLNEGVRAKYEEYQDKYKRGELSEEQAVATIATLRSQSRNPENIIEDEISNILDSISEDKIEKYHEEHEFLKCKVAKEVEDNAELKKVIDSKENEIKKQELLFEQEQRINKQNELLLQQDVLKSKEQLLAEKNRNKETLEIQKTQIDINVAQKYRNFRIFIAICFLIYYLIICILIWKLGWNLMEPVIYIIGVAPLIISYLYLLVFGKTINPIDYLKNKKEKNYQNNYNRFKFDLKRLDDLRQEICNIEREIKDLTDKIDTIKSDV